MNRREVMQVRIDSIYENTTYSNSEMIFVDNGNEKSGTTNYLNHIQHNHTNIHSVQYANAWNFSEINNKPIFKHDSDEYGVPMNNDAEILTPNWQNRMFFYA